MQQEQAAFLYRSDGEYTAHAAAMAQQGWVIVHQQRNGDGTISATWRRIPPPAPWTPAIPQAAARPAQTMVREYRSADAFNRASRNLAKKGWVLVGQSAGITRTAVAKNIRNTMLTLGINRITPGIGGVARKTTIVATYQRER